MAPRGRDIGIQLELYLVLGATELYQPEVARPENPGSLARQASDERFEQRGESSAWLCQVEAIGVTRA